MIYRFRRYLRGMLVRFFYDPDRYALVIYSADDIITVLQGKLAARLTDRGLTPEARSTYARAHAALTEIEGML